MLNILACLVLGSGSDTLPNEVAALENLHEIWRVATGGTSHDFEVSTRRLSQDRPLGDLGLWSRSRQKPHQTQNSVLYRLSDGSIVSAQFDRDKDTAYMPVHEESDLRERAVKIAALLTPKRFSSRSEQSFFHQDRSEFWLQWSYVVDGYPTHQGPLFLALDARTSKPVRLHAPSFDWKTDAIVKPKFTEEECYKVAWAKYLEVKPIAVALHSRKGARWVAPRFEQDPAELAKATVPIAYWASDKYRAHLAEQRAALAYSFGFGWQDVLVDAVTGEAMLVWGGNLYGDQYDTLFHTSRNLTGRVWHLPLNPKAAGTLRLIDYAGRPQTTRIALVSDNLTLVGQYFAPRKLLWVDHPAGTKCYEVTGELARVLAKE